jgi:putative transposase
MLKYSWVIEMRYTTDLTDTQWELMEKVFKSKKGRNFQKHSKRELVNAVPYRNKTRCQWRLLPKDFPNHDTVRPFYRRAVKNGKWEKAIDKIATKVHVDTGRTPEPSYCLIDSQSVKTTNCNEDRGIDEGKKGQRAQKAYCD